MENSDIPDANIMASQGNEKGRLNAQIPFYLSRALSDPWVQANIGYQTCVSGLVTQGDGGHSGADDWVTSFWVSTYQVDLTSTQTFIKENGQNKVSLISDVRIV